MECPMHAGPWAISWQILSFGACDKRVGWQILQTHKIISGKWGNIWICSYANCELYHPKWRSIEWTRCHYHRNWFLKSLSKQLSSDWWHRMYNFRLNYKWNFLPCWEEGSWNKYNPPYRCWLSNWWIFSRVRLQIWEIWCFQPFLQNLLRAKKCCWLWITLDDPSWKWLQKLTLIHELLRKQIWASLQRILPRPQNRKLYLQGSRRR